jgi:hypothetical protein
MPTDINPATGLSEEEERHPSSISTASPPLENVLTTIEKLKIADGLTSERRASDSAAQYQLLRQQMMPVDLVNIDSR